MIQNKILNFWDSLPTKEKRIIKTASLFLTIILSSFYLVSISEAISDKKRSLAIAESNFFYTFEKAKNFEQFLMAQQAISQLPELSEFVFSESKRFQLIDFQLGEEDGVSYIAFKDKSAINYSKFIESIVHHPEINITKVNILPRDSSHYVKIFFKNM
tara:strand:+ start:11668 stop:12141 length:474 start_codon:yes stop_codon:yes gene_type:complete